MINLYTPAEIELIKKSSQITGASLKEVLSKVAPGVSTLELDAIAEQLIVQHGGFPSFKMEKDYRHATCMNVNDMVVHGVPTDYKLKLGDRLGVDLGTVFKGFHSDASWSVIVGENDLPPSDELKEKRNFLNAGQKALDLAIRQCRAGSRIGHVSKAMQDTVEGAGYSCVRQLVGHGVGRKLHEDPEVPCFLKGKIENTPEIKVGMVLAVEIIYNMGGAEIAYASKDDGWTIVTKDYSLSGLFEHTVAIRETGPEILTAVNQ